MPNSYNVGCKSVKMGDFNATTGAVSNLVALEVYRDTVQITEAEPTATKHYKVGSSSPIKINLMDGVETAAFSVVNTGTASFATLFGGTVATVDGKATWNRPKGHKQEIIKALVVETLDGAVYTIPRGSWRASKNLALTETGIALIPVIVEVTDTGLANIADVTWADPAA